MIQPKINRQVNQKSQILKVDNTDSNAGINQNNTEESKRKQAVIRDAHEQRIRRQQSSMGQIARINTDPNAGINQKIAEELKRKQAVIHDANEERIRRQQSKMGQIARINSGGTDGVLRWRISQADT
ncbi:unnamed protein product [Adineta steineri]|uniref:Uncharacterized protein n=1 Tax=Adineta steineri TaxID=433720 RepID=A0A820FEC3_9BILA|nr:unnamed protein product [Adineta steineri]CAF4261702.1 unnamed protein product [Adineta steineri]